MDIDEMKVEVNDLFGKADGIENAISDRAAKMRIRNIEKMFVSFETGISALANRIKANGSIFNEFEGIKSDFETIKSMVNSEKYFLNR